MLFLNGNSRKLLDQLLVRVEALEQTLGSKAAADPAEQAPPPLAGTVLVRVEALEQTLGQVVAADQAEPPAVPLAGTVLGRTDELEHRADQLEQAVGRLEKINSENVHETFVALFRRLEHLEAVVGDLALKTDHLVHTLAEFSRSAEQQIADVYNAQRRENDHEARRVDYILGEMEGLAPLREEFHAARRTADYARAFDEAEPLISVCVATYNRSDLLIERCLNSLINQTYRNLQIIVVGDHCTDDTEERVRALNDPRIEFHNLPVPSVYPPPGIDRWRVAGTSAFNAARARARGLFVAHLDDDDSCDVSRIEILVQAAQEHRADLVWHSHWQEHPDGQWTVSHSEEFKLTRVNMGMCLYHRFFLRLDFDVHAYRMDEPGDWNFLRKVKHLRPTMHFVDQPLSRYFALPKRPAFVPRPDESYLD